MIRPFIIGFATTLKHIFKKKITVNYPGPEDSGVPEVPRQTGADARRERAGEVRRVRPVRRRLPGRRHLPRGGGERRRRAGRPALREGLPDPQDALHLLRLLRRGLPGVGDLHGQGLRARRLQQQGLHLGQDRTCWCRRRHDHDQSMRPAFAPSSAPSATSTAISTSVRRDHRAAIPRCRSGCASATSRTTTGATKPCRRAALLDPRQQRRTSTRSPPATCRRTCSILDERSAIDARSRACASPASAEHSRRPGTRHRLPICRIRRSGTSEKATRRSADKRRHFVREEVEAMQGAERRSIFS